MYCPKCGVQTPDDAKFCSGCGSRLRIGVVVMSERATTHYAGFWRRFVATIIDDVILAIGAFVCAFFAVGAEVLLDEMGIDIPNIQAITEGFTYVLGIVVTWLYFTLLESSSEQATLGKMAQGIVVTDLSGNRISFGRANGRYWGKIVSGMILLVGYIMAGFTQKKQALHDIMAGTLVVKK